MANGAAVGSVSGGRGGRGKARSGREGVIVNLPLDQTPTVVEDVVEPDALTPATNPPPP